jgi:hypothetical protein
MKKDIKCGVIATIIGIVAWIIFFISYNCSGEQCLGKVFMIFPALVSIIGFWLIGILIGKTIYEKKKKLWEYLLIIAGIIIVALIIFWFVKISS